MSENSMDVIVIGAGAAGLMAARELALTGKSVIILEAGERSGGRIKTVAAPSGYPVELGAEFVHGDLPITKVLMQKAGLEPLPVKGSFWQHKNGKLQKRNEFIAGNDVLEEKLNAVETDLPVAEFLATEFAAPGSEELRASVMKYVEGYYAADPARASTIALREEQTKNDEEQYRPSGGYTPLIDWLEADGRQHGVQFFFSEEVVEVAWEKNNVQVKTSGKIYMARKLIVTVSIGVLQQEAIRFLPALPEKTEAAKKLGFGNVLKLNLLFDDCFWKKKSFTGRHTSQLGFLFSDEQIPTWWTQHPANEPLLVGWLGGPRSISAQPLDEKTVIQQSLTLLSHIFLLHADQLLEKLRRVHFHNWQYDPHFGGAYSYEVVNGHHYQGVLLEPVEDTVYFAGEGLQTGPQIGTVEAAFATGRDAAHKLIASF